MLITDAFTRNPVFVLRRESATSNAPFAFHRTRRQPAALRCTIVYQACNQFSCRPAEKISLESEIRVIP